MLLKKGFDGFILKVLALILMVFDHIHYFSAGIWEAPEWFNMIGRLSAPLFIFMAANGMCHTRNPKKYISRLYIGSAFMVIGNQIVNKYFPLPGGGIVANSIFSTLCIITLMIYAIQKMQKDRKENKKIVGGIILFLLPVISGVIVMALLSFIQTAPSVGPVIGIFMAFAPNIMTCEGGPLFVVLGLGFYIFHNSKKKTAIFYLLFCIVILVSGYNPEFGIMSMFIYNIQWMMVFALPLILLYNGQRGHGMKYFFYIFYPAHIYLFAIVASTLAK